MLVALWVYVTADGVGRARQLDRLCQEHDAYRWLVDEVPINYHTLYDFRVEHGRVLNDLLSEVLAAMMAAGLVNPERISQDGLRVRAAAGAGSFRREARLKGFLEQAKARVGQVASELTVEAGQPAVVNRPNRRVRAARARPSTR